MLWETAVSQFADQVIDPVKTDCLSFRVPEYLEDVAMKAASEKRVPYAEFKKSVWYRGLLAYVVDDEDPPMEYGRNISATLPDLGR